MSAKIKKLRLVEPRPNSDLVRMLRQQTARAERGEITGCAMAMTQHDGTTATCYSPPHDQYARLVGSVSYLLYRVQRDW